MCLVAALDLNLKVSPIGEGFLYVSSGDKNSNSIIVEVQYYYYKNTNLSSYLSCVFLKFGQPIWAELNSRHTWIIILGENVDNKEAHKTEILDQI